MSWLLGRDFESFKGLEYFNPFTKKINLFTDLFVCVCEMFVAMRECLLCVINESLNHSLIEWPVVLCIYHFLNIFFMKNVWFSATPNLIHTSVQVLVKGACSFSKSNQWNVPSQPVLVCYWLNHQSLKARKQSPS